MSQEGGLKVPEKVQAGWKAHGAGVGQRGGFQRGKCCAVPSLKFKTYVYLWL